MTRNQRKKAYLKVLDLMEGGEHQIDALRECFNTDKDHKEFIEILKSIKTGLTGAWYFASHEDDKNFIALCIALCDKPL
jgi:hypothetical protein